MLRHHITIIDDLIVISKLLKKLCLTDPSYLTKDKFGWWKILLTILSLPWLSIKYIIRGQCIILSSLEHNDIIKLYRLADYGCKITAVVLEGGMMSTLNSYFGVATWQYSRNNYWKFNFMDIHRLLIK